MFYPVKNILLQSPKKPCQDRVPTASLDRMAVTTVRGLATGRSRAASFFNTFITRLTDSGALAVDSCPVEGGL